MLWTSSACTSARRTRSTLSLPEINARELFTLVPLAAIVLVLGIYPTPILDLLERIAQSAKPGRADGARASGRRDGAVSGGRALANRRWTSATRQPELFPARAAAHGGVILLVVVDLMVRDKSSLGDMALVITAGALVLIAIEPAAARRVAVPADAGARRLRGLLQRAARAGRAGRGLDVARLGGGARLRPGRVLRHPARQHARDVPDGVGGQPADGVPGARVREPHVLRPDRFPAPQPPLAGGRAEVPDLRRRRVGRDDLRHELDFRPRRLAGLCRHQPGARRDRPIPVLTCSSRWC